MKRLMVALLMTIACNNAFGMQEENRLDNQKIEAKETVNQKRNFIKGLAGISLAGLFGYLSYKIALRTIVSIDPTENQGIIGKIDNWVFGNIYQRFLDLSFDKTSNPNNQNHQYVRLYFIPILTAIASFECAKYGISKLSPIITSNVKEIIDLVKFAREHPELPEVQNLKAWWNNFEIRLTALKDKYQKI